MECYGISSSIIFIIFFGLIDSGESYELFNFWFRYRVGFGCRFWTGLTVAPAPFRCYDCQGIDLANCLAGGIPPVKHCGKGVTACYMSYRKAGASKFQVISSQLKVSFVYCSKSSNQSEDHIRVWHLVKELFPQTSLPLTNFSNHFSPQPIRWQEDVETRDRPRNANPNRCARKRLFSVCWPSSALAPVIFVTATPPRICRQFRTGLSWSGSTKIIPLFRFPVRLDTVNAVDTGICWSSDCSVGRLIDWLIYLISTWLPLDAEKTNSSNFPCAECFLYPYLLN